MLRNQGQATAEFLSTPSVSPPFELDFDATALPAGEARTLVVQLRPALERPGGRTYETPFLALEGNFAPLRLRLEGASFLEPPCLKLDGGIIEVQERCTASGAISVKNSCFEDVTVPGGIAPTASFFWRLDAGARFSAMDESLSHFSARAAVGVGQRIESVRLTAAEHGTRREYILDVPVQTSPRRTAELAARNHPRLDMALTVLNRKSVMSPALPLPDGGCCLRGYEDGGWAWDENGETLPSSIWAHSKPAAIASALNDSGIDFQFVFIPSWAGVNSQYRGSFMDDTPYFHPEAECRGPQPLGQTIFTNGVHPERFNDRFWRTLTAGYCSEPVAYPAHHGALLASMLSPAFIWNPPFYRDSVPLIHIAIGVDQSRRDLREQWKNYDWRFPTRGQADYPYFLTQYRRLRGDRFRMLFVGFTPSRYSADCEILGLVANGYPSGRPQDSLEPLKATLRPAVEATNGVWMDYCAPDWGEALQAVLQEARRFESEYFLDGPVDPTEPIRVTVDGTAAEFDYVATPPMVRLKAIPPRGAEIRIDYSRPCP